LGIFFKTTIGFFAIIIETPSPARGAVAVAVWATLG
jgi:hypothetical protein